MVKGGFGALTKFFKKRKPTSSAGKRPYKKKKIGQSKVNRFGKKRKIRRDRKNKRKHPQDSHQYDVDYLLTRSRYGRPISRAKRIKKLVSTDSRVDIYGIRKYNAWGAGVGAITMSSNQAGALGTVVESPIHLFDLSAVPQSNAAGTVLYPSTHYVLGFTNELDTGNVRWLTFDGAGALNTTPTDDLSFSTLNKERLMYLMTSTGRGQFPANNTLNNTQFVGAHSILEKFAANILFYGARDHCTKFEISLVQLTEDVSPHSTSDRATAVWQAMHKSYGYSPLEIGNTRLISQHIKVLKRETFILDSPAAGESDAAARIRQYKFHGFLNRKCDYNWGKYTDRMLLNNQDTQENGNSNLNYATHVHPKARVYMMIRAMVPYTTGAATPATQASYDLHLTTVHRNLVTA